MTYVVEYTDPKGVNITTRIVTVLNTAHSLGRQLLDLPIGSMLVSITTEEV